MMDYREMEKTMSQMSKLYNILQALYEKVEIGKKKDKISSQFVSK